MRNPWIYRAPALAWGFLIIYLSLAPVQDLDPGWELNVSDKLAHGVLYFTWVVLLYFGPSRSYQKPVSRRKMAFYWAFAIACGVGLEFLQGVMNFGRSADALDALANTGGAIIAIIGSRFLHKFLA